MDDRTMLELAAKAVEYRLRIKGAFFIEVPDYVHLGNIRLKLWNPLTDDGDALRLASELHINIEFVKGLTTKQFIEISAYPSGRGDCLCLEPIEDDPNQAARRAITRAAAEIQLAKESGK